MRFGGHADDMIVRLRNNAILRSRYRVRHERISNAFKTELANPQLKRKDLTKADIDKIKSKIRSEIRKENKRNFLNSITITIVIAAFIVYLLLNTVFAQGFVSEGNQWNVRLISFGTSTEVFKINGDSTLNNLSYKKLFSTNDTALINWYYLGLLREDSNIIYYIPKGYEEDVLYDFNLELGDTSHAINTFCPENPVEVIVYDVDTIEYFGVERKRWLINEDWGEYWIEGIGSTCGPVYSQFYECIVCPSWDLLCFHQNDELLYSLPGNHNCWVGVGIPDNLMENGIELFPNPAKDKFEVRSAESEVQGVDIYTSNGQNIYSEEYTGSKSVVIDASKFNTGIYVCQIMIKGQSVIRKLIIH